MAGVCFCEKMTLSTDLEQGVISDMAAGLWQAAAATAPVRSSGQMAVVNAEAQSTAVICSTSVHRDDFTDSLGVCKAIPRSFFSSFQQLLAMKGRRAKY